MLFNSELLFIHVPKTGGMAVTKHLLQVLARPVYYSHPDVDANAASTDDGVIHIRGIRHETLSEAASLVRKCGFELSRFRALLAVVRNPYELEVSRYAYLQKGHSWDQGINQTLALEGDFERFATDSSEHSGADRPIQAYYTIDGGVPPNLKILRAENLESELRAALRSVGVIADRPLQVENWSNHGPPVEYYTQASERAVYRRYKWVFDNAFYPRMCSAQLPTVRQPPVTGPNLPIFGPVKQVGISSGYWHDSWVGKKLVFNVYTKADPSDGFIMKGTFVKGAQKELGVQVKINHAIVYQGVQTCTPFTIEVDCNFPTESSILLEVESDNCFWPADLGVSDDSRELAFQLSSFSFRPSANRPDTGVVQAAGVY